MRLLVVMALLSLALLAAQDSRAQSTTVTEKSFDCIRNGVKVRNTYIRNADPAKQAEAVRIFRDGVTDTEYPTGTILQLLPIEAMVKHARQEFPNSGGWEYFTLDVSAAGTKITGRGEEAKNPLGTCQSCHQAATNKYDFVCERTHGCAPVPLTDEVIVKIQASDPRCTATKAAP